MLSNITNLTTDLLPTEANNSPDNVLGLKGKVRFAYFVIGSLGLLGNGLVVTVIFGFTTMRSKLTNLFIVHQSIIDMLTSFVLLLFTLTTGQYYIPGILGEFVCRVWVNGYVMWNLFVTSSFNLLALTIERYFGIVHPILHKVTFSRTKAFLMMAVCWFIGPLINLYNPLTTALDEHNRCLVVSFWPNLQVRRATGIINILAKYFAPIITMIYCYSRIIYVLQNKAAISDAPQIAVIGAPVNILLDQKNKRQQKAKKNVVKTLVIVCFCFIFCWSWNQFFYILANLGVSVRFDSDFYEFSVIAVFANCCINPFIYIMKYGEFKVALRRLFCQRFGRVGPQSGEGEGMPPTGHGTAQ